MVPGLLSLTACAGPGSPEVRPADAPDFDETALVDVLPPDAIRSIDQPRFEPSASADWLEPRSPVLAFAHRGEARAYPLGILTRHEIVNDEIGGTPVAVTYCPLCNSGLVYERTLNGRVLTFGVSGKLYHSDLVMFDRETSSLWPQIQGVAVEGDLKGSTLVPLASAIVSFDDFRSRYPEGRVLARPASRSYDDNPYAGYDSRSGPTGGFFRGEVDERLDAMERVVGIAIGDEARAYPYGALQDASVVHDEVGGTQIVVFWGGEAASALDRPLISEGRRVGGSGVFEPLLDGRRLTFQERDGAIVDSQTGSTWSLLGQATAGKLAGATLTPLHHLDAFWFAWAAFVPFTEIWSA